MLPDEPTSETAEVAETESQSTRDFEAEAKPFGWKPKDEYKGKSAWTDAETYLGKVELSQRVTQKLLADKDAEYADRLSRIERNADIAVEAAKKASANEIAYWQGQARAAAAKGDLPAFDAATEAVDKAKAQAPKVQAAPVRSETEDADAKFATENPWYGKDKTMTAFARGQSLELLDENPNMTIAENRRLVAEAVREQFPQKFAGETKTKFSAVDGGSAFPSAGRNGGGKGYDSLPPEAKAASDKFVKMGLFKDGNEYAKDYYAGAKNAR